MIFQIFKYVLSNRIINLMTGHFFHKSSPVWTDRIDVVADVKCYFAFRSFICYIKSCGPRSFACKIVVSCHIFRKNWPIQLS